MHVNNTVENNSDIINIQLNYNVNKALDQEWKNTSLVRVLMVVKLMKSRTSKI